MTRLCLIVESPEKSNPHQGRGVLKIKILEEKYVAKLEFPTEIKEECKTKNLPWGKGYFQELHNIEKIIFGKCYGN